MTRSVHYYFELPVNQLGFLCPFKLGGINNNMDSKRIRALKRGIIKLIPKFPNNKATKNELKGRQVGTVLASGDVETVLDFAFYNYPWNIINNI